PRPRRSWYSARARWVPRPAAAPCTSSSFAIHARSWSRWRTRSCTPSLGVVISVFPDLGTASPAEHVEHHLHHLGGGHGLHLGRLRELGWLEERALQVAVVRRPSPALHLLPQGGRRGH